MKSLATALVLSLASAASAADSSVSKVTLDRMGLGTMQSLSDREGAAVRGKGSFAGVWGGSTANFGGQFSSNNYSAGSSWLGKGSAAGGRTFSFGGQFQFQGFGS